MSRRRQLSDEERALWSGFTRSIKPLRRGPRGATSPPAGEPAPSPPVAPQQPVTQHPPKAAKPPPLAPMDRRMKQRVARGREPIEARIDLHGMTQAQAHAALLRFLRGAQADGKRMALVVTGKGTAKTSRGDEGHDSHERGVLRRQVPMWLALPEFRPLVIGFDGAHAGHGGDGAFYVRLRRAP